jgi:hypothetical protein
MKIVYKYKQLKPVLTTIIVLIFVSISFAGAWPEKKGGGFYKLSFRYLKGDKIYNSSGDKVAIHDFTDLTFGFYGTYGLKDNITLLLNVIPFKSEKLSNFSTAETNYDVDESGFGDTGLGIKYCLAKVNQTVVSTSLKFGFPTGKTDGVLWTGHKDFSQTLAIEAGHSFYPTPFYITGLAAYTNRNEGFSDEFRFLIEGGYNFAKGFTVIGRIHCLASVKNGNEDVSGGFGIFQNNVQYYAYNIELVYKLTDNFGMSAYYESGGGGRNIISAPVLNAGVFYTL